MKGLGNMPACFGQVKQNKMDNKKFSRILAVVCTVLQWFVVVCLQLPGFTAYRPKFWWWFVVVCGGLRWFAVVCGGLSFSHTHQLLSSTVGVDNIKDLTCRTNTSTKLLRQLMSFPANHTLAFVRRNRDSYGWVHKILKHLPRSRDTIIVCPLPE